MDGEFLLQLKTFILKHEWLPTITNQFRGTIGQEKIKAWACVTLAWVAEWLPHLAMIQVAWVRIPELTLSAPNSLKGWVCAVISVWLVHTKEHVWTIWTCPTTILLPVCVCVQHKKNKKRLTKRHAEKRTSPTWRGRPVCSPGSWSGRRWLPLITEWHRSIYLGHKNNVKHCWKFYTLRSCNLDYFSCE